MANWAVINKGRLRGHLVYGTTDKDGMNGVFLLCVHHTWVKVIASDGSANHKLNLPAWKHVSVSLKDSHKPPTWEIMEAIKRLFFEPEDVCMQLHVAEQDHINVHPGVLHIWQPPPETPIPLPPKEFV